MIPQLTDDGFLPPGIHRATMQEIEDRFATFQRSNQRIQLAKKFRKLVEESSKSSIVQRVILAGSYVTNKSEPNDFDYILEVVDHSSISRTPTSDPMRLV